MDPEKAMKPLTEWEEADKRQFEAIQKNLTDRVETMLTIVEKLRDNKLPERKTKELIKKLEEHKNISKNLEDKRLRLVGKYALKWGVKEQGGSKDK